MYTRNRLLYIFDLLEIFDRVLSGVFTAYIIRLVDKLTHKNNRPDQ
uniref:Uncharacterized protein n=1 Tax=Siphoviridae sp. ctL0q1 TaxID=2825449 RepID=A0A8S5PK58_9CAUD|nr:MAG TPA: hypothetical protein [Siphoviridae sp. ctL0q1]